MSNRPMATALVTLAAASGGLGLAACGEDPDPVIATAPPTTVTVTAPVTVTVTAPPPARTQTAPAAPPQKTQTVPAAPPAKTQTAPPSARVLRCGVAPPPNPRGRFAGVADVRAKRTSCKRARRIASAFAHREIQSPEGFTCTRTPGEAMSTVRCTLGSRVVRFITVIF
ncbi:MAG: hypothetical protein ACR2LK_00245 [Solirubrobacteraceae bacterium]